MPRTMNPDSTGVVRALVERVYPNGKVFTKAYGPYADSTSCRDMEPGDKPTRVQKQKLKPTDRYDLHPNGLVWQTIKTTYTNGGEDVNWDDQ